MTEAEYKGKNGLMAVMAERHTLLEACQLARRYDSQAKHVVAG